MFKKYDRKRCQPVIDEITDWASVGEGRVLRRSGTNGGLIYEFYSEPVALFSGDLVYFNCGSQKNWTTVLKEAGEIFGIPIEVKREKHKIAIKYAGTWRREFNHGHILIRIPQPEDSFRPALSA